jgi:outer membrane murein-binding lipoprotein Lpp
MTKLLTLGAAVLAGLLTSGAAPERSGERGAERCTDAQDISVHGRCARLNDNLDQNNQTTGEQTVCEKNHGGCATGDGRINRTVRPPFWIGHHYSGL